MCIESLVTGILTTSVPTPRGLRNLHGGLFIEAAHQRRSQGRIPEARVSVTKGIKTEQIPFGYLECSYGPRNVRNRFRRDELLLSELKDTSKVHLSSELGPFEGRCRDSSEFPLKSLLLGQWEMYRFSMEIGHSNFKCIYLEAQMELHDVLGC